MARVVTDDKHYTDIAIAIREKTGGDKTYKPSEMPLGVGEVYDKGHADGIQSEYDRFWYYYQTNGEIQPYSYAFAGSRWNDITYNPKYNIRANNINNMFMYSGITDTKVNIDIRTTTTNKNNAFQYSKLINIRKIILPADTTAFTFPNWFASASNLKYITFEGGNICKSIDFSSSPLEVETMKHIISRLENHSGTDNEGVNSVKFKSTCWTALEADSTAPDGGTWKNYVISLGWLT